MADDEGLTPQRARRAGRRGAARPRGDVDARPHAGLDRRRCSGGLLDLDVNVDLDADAAAPVNAGVAANANIAAPIDAAVSANILSPDATSAAVASQTSVINQDLDGVAIADTDQTSDIGQGEVGADATAGSARREHAAPPCAAGVAVLACAAPLGVAQAQDATARQRQPRDRDDRADGGARSTSSGRRVPARRRRRPPEHRQRRRALHRLPRDGDRVPDRARRAASPRASRRTTRRSPINDQCTSCVVYAGARQFVARSSTSPCASPQGRSARCSTCAATCARSRGQDLTAGQLAEVVEAGGRVARRADRTSSSHDERQALARAAQARSRAPSDGDD